MYRIWNVLLEVVGWDMKGGVIYFSRRRLQAGTNNVADG